MCFTCVWLSALPLMLLTWLPCMVSKQCWSLSLTWVIVCCHALFWRVLLFNGVAAFLLYCLHKYIFFCKNAALHSGSGHHTTLDIQVNIILGDGKEPSRTEWGQLSGWVRAAALTWRSTELRAPGDPHETEAWTLTPLCVVIVTWSRGATRTALPRHHSIRCYWLTDAASASNALWSITTQLFSTDTPSAALRRCVCLLAVEGIVHVVYIRR